MNLPLFDAAEGRQRRDKGLELAEEHSRDWAEEMRAYARSVAQRTGQVSIDDCRLHAEMTDSYPHHSNAWGSIFRTAEWEHVGWIESRLPSNHSRHVRTWKLKKSC